MGDVVYVPVITSLDMDPKRVLAGAQDSGLSEVVVIGWDASGEFYFASSLAAGSKVTWYLTRALHKLHEIEDEIESGEISGPRLKVPEGPTGDVRQGPWKGELTDGGGI